MVTVNIPTPQTPDHTRRAPRGQAATVRHVNADGLPDLAQLSLGTPEEEPAKGALNVDQQRTPINSRGTQETRARTPVSITINTTNSTVVMHPPALVSPPPTPTRTPARRRQGVVIATTTPRIAATRSVAAGSMSPRRRVPSNHSALSMPTSPRSHGLEIASDTAPSDILSLHADEAVNLQNVAGAIVSPLAPSADHTPATDSDGIPWDPELEHIEPAVPRCKKWYVVTAGLKVGIWGSWVDMAAYVDGVPGNVHQSFKSRAEAEEYYYYNKDNGRVLILSL